MERELYIEMMENLGWLADEGVFVNAETAGMSESTVYLFAHCGATMELADELLKMGIKALKRTIEEFKTGERYMKLQKDYHRVTNGYIKEIKRLKLEIGHLNAHSISIRNMWSDDYYSMYDEKQAEIRNLKETIRRLEDKVWEERRNSDEKITKLTLEYEDRMHEKDCIIDELTNRLAHAEALLASDGNNTSLPTSKTPIGKKKRIPNTREKSGKPKGGQLGHEKHELEKTDESDITDVVEHDSDEEGFLCPRCDGDNFIPTGECDIKYEYDVEVVVKKIKHVFYHYQCVLIAARYLYQKVRYI